MLNQNKPIAPQVLWQTKDSEFEIIPIADFATMQSIEYHENGKVARIVFRSAAEIINIAALIECHLTKRAPDECHESVCEHKFTPVTNTLEVCVLCGIRR